MYVVMYISFVVFVYFVFKVRALYFYNFQSHVIYGYLITFYSVLFLLEQSIKTRDQPIKFLGPETGSDSDFPLPSRSIHNSFSGHILTGQDTMCKVSRRVYLWQVTLMPFRQLSLTYASLELNKWWRSGGGNQDVAVGLQMQLGRLLFRRKVRRAVQGGTAEGLMPC